MNKLIADTKRPISLTIFNFVLLFLVYHLPEFLQQRYQKPLLAVFELGMLLFVVIAFVIGKRSCKNGFGTYGLVSFSKHKGNLMKGLLIGIAITSLANFIPVWMGWSRISIQINVQHFASQSILFAIGTLLPSLAEDILTRGFVKVHYPEKWNINWLIPLSAVIYVLNHIFRLNKPDVVLYLFILGLLLMWAFRSTGSLWLTLGIHWGSNIAYQVFTNLMKQETIRENNLENYLLAACIALGFVITFLLYKQKAFSIHS